jgi:hypothetical protein
VALGRARLLSPIAILAVVLYFTVWLAVPSGSSGISGNFPDKSENFSDKYCVPAGATSTRVFRPAGLRTGTGADNTNPIQEAIDSAAAAGGGVISLPAGTYTVDGHLVLKSKVRLTGAGPKTVLKAGPRFLDSTGPDGGFPVLTTSGASDVTISNLTVDQSGNTRYGRATTANRFRAYLVDVRNSQDVVVDGVSTRNPFT